MVYARLEDALRNTLPVNMALIPEDPVLPTGYSAWQDKYGTVHITSWKGVVYEVQEYNCSPDGTVTHSNRVTKNSKIRIVLVSVDGFTTPEDMMLDQKPMQAVGAASAFGSFGASLKTSLQNSAASAIGGAINGIGSALGGAISGALAGASSLVKGVVDKVKGFFNPGAAGPQKVVGELMAKTGIGKIAGVVAGAGGPASGDSKSLQTTVQPSEKYTSNKSVMGMIEHPFAVKIVSAVNPDTKIVFTVSPTVDESCSAAYDSYQPIHFPSAIQVFKSTNARTLNVNGKFISRTPQEASRTLEFLNYIRSWVMPYFGKGTGGAESEYQGKLGAPPDILILSAYGKYNLGDVPVVMMTYSWTYPEDIDYIPSETGQPVPRIIDVSLSFVETHAPAEFENFDLAKYKDGDLHGAYNYKTTRADASTRRGLSLNGGKWFGEKPLGSKEAKAAAAGPAKQPVAVSSGLAGPPPLRAIKGGELGNVTDTSTKAGDVPAGSDPKPEPKAEEAAGRECSVINAEISDISAQIAATQAKIDTNVAKIAEVNSSMEKNEVKIESYRVTYANDPAALAAKNDAIVAARAWNNELLRLNEVAKGKAQDAMSELNTKLDAAKKEAQAKGC